MASFFEQLTTIESIQALIDEGARESEVLEYKTCGWQNVRRSGKAAVRSREVDRKCAKMVRRTLRSDREIPIEEDLSGSWAWFVRPWLSVVDLLALTQAACRRY